MIDYGIKNYSVVFKNELYYYEKLVQIVAEDKQRLHTQIRSNYKPVGLCVSRGIEIITMMQAMLESGITFVPISIDFPTDRMKYIIEDSGMEYIITDQKCDFGECKIISLEEKCSKDAKTVYLARNNEIAYIMYTSGTTGTPKGIEVTRSGLMNFLEAIPKRISVSCSDTVACFTNNTFDIFFLESLLAMNRGCKIVLASDEEQTNPSFLCRLIENNKVSLLQMAPSRMALVAIFDKDLKSLRSVEKILIGGETFPKSLLQLLQKKTNAKIYNMYEPVEATIWVTVADLTEEQDINIGEPLNQINVFIGDENCDCLPTGELGEICIEGICLARGYYNNDALTRKNFVQKEDRKIYRTGDIGRINERGLLEHLGRNDTQVKIRGYRVELEEIDICIVSNVASVKGVASCYLPGKESGELIAFYVGKEEIAVSEFTNSVRDMLPQYMIPSKYIRIDNLIYTHSGKIDRKAMLNQYEALLNQSEKVEENQLKANRSKEETLFEDIFDIISNAIEADRSKILGCEDLRDIGMDSLKFISVIVTIEDIYEIEFEDEMLSMGRLRTVTSFVDYVGDLLKRNEGKI